MERCHFFYRIRVAFFLSLLILLAGNHAIAGTVSWVGGTGNWNTPTNWDPAGVPGPGDGVLITEDGTYTVTLDVDAIVASLTLGGSTGT